MITTANHDKNLQALRERLRVEKENFSAHDARGVEGTLESEMWSDYIEEIENEIHRLESEMSEIDNPNNSSN